MGLMVFSDGADQRGDARYRKEKVACPYLKSQSADSLPKAIKPAAYRHSA